MSDHTSIGDRMKRQYEAATRYRLPRRTYTVIRVDGRAFHKFLSNVEKPFDHTFVRLMDDVLQALTSETGAQFGYAQSDEVSVLLTDFASITAQPWFGGVVQKMASIAAGTATAEFSHGLGNAMLRGGFCVSLRDRPVFDARVFTVPDPVEVANYFLWRQEDAIRNSVLMAGQAYFTSAELHRKPVRQVREMLQDLHNVSWEDYPEGIRQGRICNRVIDGQSRSAWLIRNAPRFAAEPDNWLARHIPPLPSLEG